MAIHWGSYRSGQTGLTVNQLAYAYGGSNPPLPTDDHWAATQSYQRHPSAVWLSFSARRLRAFDREESGPTQWMLSPNSIADIHARVAQGQSTILVRLGSRVQFPSRAPTVPPMSATLCVVFTPVNDRRECAHGGTLLCLAHAAPVSGVRACRQIDALARYNLVASVA